MSSDSPQPDDSSPHMEIDPKLLESLVCPLTHGPLTYDRERNELRSEKARMVFPIREGVPIMLRSEAREAD